METGPVCVISPGSSLFVKVPIMGFSSAGKGFTSLLSFVMFNCVFVTFPCGILGYVWYMIVSIPDLCQLYYFVTQRVKLCLI